jgi:hypothetical protein
LFHFTVLILLFFYGLKEAASGELGKLSCNRVEPQQGKCELVKSGIFYTGNKIFALNELQGARLERYIYSKNRKYQIVIITSNGEETLTSILDTDYSEKQETVSRIESFLKNPGQKSLVIEQDDRTGLLIFGGLISSFSFILIATLVPLRTYTFDKAVNRFTFKTQNLFSRKVIEYELDEILGFKVETDDNGQHIVFLYLPSGKTFTFTIPFSFLYTRAEKEELFQYIMEFLTSSI